MENYHLIIHMSMINRLSNLINRNRSAAKISQVLCSTTYALAIISNEALKTALDCRISACELAPQLFATSGDLMTTMYLSAPLSCICLHRSLVFVCIALLYLLFQCCLPRTVVEIVGWRQSYNKPLSTTPLSLLR